MFAEISAVIAYQTCLTFWTAAFPGLARNTSQLRARAEEYNAGKISRDEYDYADTMQRSRLSNMAFYIQSCGEIVILAVIVGVLYGVNVRASEANNNWGLSVLYVHLGVSPSPSAWSPELRIMFLKQMEYLKAPETCRSLSHGLARTGYLTNYGVPDRGNLSNFHT